MELLERPKVLFFFFFFFFYVCEDLLLIVVQGRNIWMVGSYLTYLWQEARSTVCSSGFPLMGIKVYFTASRTGIPIILIFLLCIPRELRL